MIAGPQSRLPNLQRQDADVGAYLDQFIYQYETATDDAFFRAFQVQREPAFLRRAQSLREIVRKKRPHEGLEPSVEAEFKAAEDAIVEKCRALAAERPSDLARRHIALKSEEDVIVEESRDLVAERLSDLASRHIELKNELQKAQSRAHKARIGTVLTVLFGVLPIIFWFFPRG